MTFAKKAFIAAGSLTAAALTVAGTPLLAQATISATGIRQVVTGRLDFGASQPPIKSHEWCTAPSHRSERLAVLSQHLVQ